MLYAVLNKETNEIRALFINNVDAREYANELGSNYKVTFVTMQEVLMV